LELEQLDTHDQRAKERTAMPVAHNHAPARDDSLRQMQHALGNRSLERLVRAASEEMRARTQAREAPESEAARASVRDGGEPLPHSERSYFEPLFGQDFGGVRLHPEADAARAASPGSRAYALGEAIVFAPGHYAPETDAGRRLLAHELAHVVQQRQPGSDAGGDAERRADAAASEVTAGRAVAPQSVGSAAPGLHADDGTTMPFANLGWQPPPTNLFGFPPFKISSWLYLYLVTHNLLLPQMEMLIRRGEVAVDWTEPIPSIPLTPEAAGQRQLKLWADLDPLRKRLLDVSGKTLPDPMRGTDASPSKPYTPPKDSGPPFFKWKGLTDGLDLRIPHLNPNISFSGLTVDVFRKGQFETKAVAGWGGSIEIQMAYRDWHLSGSVDKDGKWELTLSYPTDAPIPSSSSMGDIFRQGEQALSESLKIVRVMPSLDTIKNKVSVLVDPLKNAADAGKGIASAKTGVNVSVFIGAGPPPGKLPPEALRGDEPPASTKKGIHAGLTLTYVF
jgi:Domain of unknown function (DUF4157)